MALTNMPKHNPNTTQTREPEHQKCDKPVGTGRYPDNVTVYCYNEHRTDTNLHERCTGIPIWAPIVLFVKLHNLNQSAPCSYDIGTMTKNFDFDMSCMSCIIYMYDLCDINHVTCDYVTYFPFPLVMPLGFSTTVYRYTAHFADTNLHAHIYAQTFS